MNAASLFLIIKNCLLTFLQAYPIILPIYTLIISLFNHDMQWFLFTCWSILSFLSAPVWKLIFRNIYILSGKNTLPLLGQGSRPHGGYDCWGFNYYSKCLADDVTYGMPSGHSLFAWMVSTYLILTLKHAELNTNNIPNSDANIKHQQPFFIFKVMALIVLALSVSVSRYISRCHTPQQLVVGALIGSGLGLLFYHVILDGDLFNKNL
jgi:membrane-associated phospholipid phosphatase